MKSRDGNPVGVAWRRAVLVALCLGGCAPHLPASHEVGEPVWLDQNWSPQQTQWYSHASQGTATFKLPYAWLIALEQPRLSLFGDVPLFVAPEYLSRFGFLFSPKSDDNPDGLPVGFARDPSYVDPISGAKMDAVGLTCAGCHTGQIEYKGTAIRIEGGPALTDLGKFRKALELAIVYTRYVPGRFGRFAGRVLKGHDSPEARSELKRQFDVAIQKGKRDHELEVQSEQVEEGFARLDAINRIGNFVFANELDAKNLAKLTAPVNYPHIWDSSWFDWVQYNGSIEQPMVRNAGEALGVLAAVNLQGPSADLYKSTVNVKALYEIEQLLAGRAPFQGLRSPRWPAHILGEIDGAQAARGAILYGKICQGCHLPPLDSKEMQDPQSPFWSPPNTAGERYLVLNLMPIQVVGTDPGQAAGMKDRQVTATSLDISNPAFGPALGTVVERTVNRWYDEQVPPVSAADRERMNGYRKNGIQAELSYKARPLDGIWATAPYLHNGSVPNLYLLLGPASERPKTFYLGSHEFDPKHVGYEYAELDGGFELDTSIPGNSNAGHEFRDAPPHTKGVVGRALSEDERWALVEYLKTLGPP